MGRIWVVLLAIGCSADPVQAAIDSECGYVSKGAFELGHENPCWRLQNDPGACFVGFDGGCGPEAPRTLQAGDRPVLWCPLWTGESAEYRWEATQCE